MKHATTNNPDLEGKTKAELTNLAAEQGVDVKSGMTKADIVDELKSTQPETGSTDAGQPFDPDSGPEALNKTNETADEIHGRAALGR